MEIVYACTKFEVRLAFEALQVSIHWFLRINFFPAGLSIRYAQGIE